MNIQKIEKILNELFYPCIIHDTFRERRINKGYVINGLNQVVLDLAIVIKELLESSVDSGATGFDVELVDYEKSLITVIDKDGFKENSLTSCTTRISPNMNRASYPNG